VGVDLLFLDAFFFSLRAVSQKFPHNPNDLTCPYAVPVLTTHIEEFYQGLSIEVFSQPSVGSLLIVTTLWKMRRIHHFLHY
jgi:hypothetical protein